MNYIKYIFAAAVLCFAACTSLPYQDDLAFAVSAQANSPEFPVYVGGALCKDVDGKPGMCSKRITTADSLVLHIDPQAYPYDLTVACTAPITVPGATVPANTPFNYALPPQQMAGLLTYICRGEVYPQDRPQPLSALFEIRVNIVDAAYLPREAMMVLKSAKGQYSLVLGQYARNAWVCDTGNCKAHSKDTMVGISDPANVQAYSESYDMRENFFNWSNPVPVTN